MHRNPSPSSMQSYASGRSSSEELSSNDVSPNDGEFAMHSRTLHSVIFFSFVCLNALLLLSSSSEYVVCHLRHTW